MSEHKDEQPEVEGHLAEETVHGTDDSPESDERSGHRRSGHRRSGHRRNEDEGPEVEGHRFYGPDSVSLDKERSPHR